MKNLISFILQFIIAISSFSSTAMLGARDYDATHAGLQISKTSVTLANAGYSEYIEAHMYAKDGSSSDVQRSAAWSCDDTTVALADSGRILALNKGTAIVTVSYNGYKKTIHVTVSANDNLEKKYAVDNGKIISTKTAMTASAARNEILKKCSSMVNYKWVPGKDLYGFDHFVFKAGNTYHGIPYTYSDDLCDETDFDKELDSKYFYQNQVIKGVSQPYYGSDCSGFVSLAWQLSERYDTEMFVDGIRYSDLFYKVGSYNSFNPNLSDLKKAYEKLQPGDAVVVNTAAHGHVFIIADNEPEMSPPQVFAYEQSPPYCQFTNYTYDNMASIGFMPFTMKNLR